MTQDELDLIHSYLNAALNEAGFARLQTLLRENAEARRTLRSLSTVDTKLQQLAAVNPTTLRLLSAPAVSETRRGFAWLSWRPLTAAAAGIVFGMLCTSMVFGFGALGSLPQVKRLFPLINGDFEEAVGTLSANPPADFGLWTGVRSEVVDETSETGPKSGKRMLRFMRGDPNASKPGAPADRCDVYQLIDLRPIWKQVGPEDEVTLALSASFLDAQAAPGKKTAFRCRILVNPGSPELVREGWPDSRMGGCAYARADLETSPATRGQWQTAQAKVFLPRNAQVVAVQLSVSRSAGSSGSDDVFRQCYADDVTLTVSSHAPSPKK